MISKAIQKSIESSSWIRKMFEEGAKLKKEIGAENVFDLSLGNPVFEPPAEVYKAIQELITNPEQGKHRYMSNNGFDETREFVAKQLVEETGLDFLKDHITMCVGAGGGLNVVIKTLCDPADEVIGFTPFFPEYIAYAANHNAIFKAVDTDDEFQIDIDKLEAAINEKTKIVLINSPNNPTGVVYTEKKLKELGELLERKSKELNREIYLLSDEPYRKIIYDNIVNPSPFLFYSRSILVTSHSKDLALPGERIGYIAISPQLNHQSLISQGLSVSNRVLGFVNAPALMQRILPKLGNARVDIGVYQRNRDLLYEHLLGLDFECIKPQGAFYLFPKCLVDDDIEFIEAAKKLNLLLTPGRGFGKKGFFRISYCFETSFIERALGKFEELKKILC